MTTAAARSTGPPDPASTVQRDGGGGDGAGREGLGTGKKLLFSFAVLVAFLAGLEGAARLGSFLFYGRNPYYLLYGFRSWANEEGVGHTEKLAGYFKFPPDRSIRFGTPEPSRINSLGFRGDDFAPAKPPGTFRVACLGASSTFGYLNRDDETYPRRLELLLEAELGEERVEVLNLGIPHFTTDHLVAAFEEEIRSYEPDLVTVYTGYNDAVRPLAESWDERLCRVLDEYSAAYAGMRKAVNAAFGDVLFGRWTPYVARMERPAIEKQVQLHRERTGANLERLIQAARAGGAALVLVRQPMTTWHERRDRGLVEQGEERVGYETEHRRLREELERRGWLHGFEVTLYVHHALQELVRELGERYGVPVVDNAALVSEEPRRLGSKVHLTAEANERLARALARVVEPLARARLAEVAQ